MTKLIKIINEQGKEVSPAELVDALRNQLAEKLSTSESHAPADSPETEDAKAKEDVRPSSEQEDKDFADQKATLEELFGVKAEEEAPSEDRTDKDAEEEARAAHEAKLAERKAKIDEFFKDAEAELPRVKAHARNAALITAGVAAGVSALAVVAVKHAFRK